MRRGFTLSAAKPVLIDGVRRDDIDLNTTHPRAKVQAKKALHFAVFVCMGNCCTTPYFDPGSSYDELSVSMIYENRRPRVLHVAGGIEPELGGLSTAILNYLASADPDVIEAHLVCALRSPSGPAARRLELVVPDAARRLTIVKRSPGITKRMDRWGISFELARWLRRHASEFDVVVAHGAWLFSSLAARSAAARARKPFVLVPHESLTEFDVSKKGSRVRKLAKRFLKQRYLNGDVHLLFTSNVEASESLERSNPSQSTVIPYPLFRDAFPDSARIGPASGAALRLGFLGRIDTKKNVDVLLDTLPLLDSRTTLLIGGSGSETLEGRLRAHASHLGLDQRVTWAGFVSVDEKNDFFGRIDLLVMPSAFESFGIVAAEAMARGVPVIVSPRTGVGEVISAHGGGIIVEPSPTSLAKAIELLASDPEMMQRLSREALRAAAEVSFERAGSRVSRHLAHVAGMSIA